MICLHTALWEGETFYAQRNFSVHVPNTNARIKHDVFPRQWKHDVAVATWIVQKLICHDDTLSSFLLNSKAQDHGAVGETIHKQR
jgi:hypothetical protein